MKPEATALGAGSERAGSWRQAMDSGDLLLVAALRREGWEQPRAATIQPTGGMAGPDHDDPAEPLRVVDSK